MTCEVHACPKSGLFTTFHYGMMLTSYVGCHSEIEHIFTCAIIKFQENTIFHKALLRVSRIRISFAEEVLVTRSN